MSIYMSRAELEEISEGLITAYANKFSNRVIQSIDIEHFITEFLMLRIEYASFAEDDAGRIGFLADGTTPLLIHQDGKIIPFVFPKDTIVLDKFLLAEKEQGRRRFTMAHEASHHILSKMYAMPSEGRFHAEYDSERSYSKEKLEQVRSEKAAERGGAHPAVIDSISVTYAQKMYACTDAKSLYVLIQEMIRELCDVVAACHQHQYSPPVRRAISYLELHISQNITLPALAKASKVSRSYLSRLFTAETGETVSHFISRTRCEKAAALLRTTDLPIQDISAHVGYLDNNYFDKVFRSYYGVTPTAYRNHR